MKVPKLFAKYNVNTNKQELVELSDEQKDTIDTLINKYDPNKPLHLIVGEAGCGKSFLINALKSFHNVKITATSARAAYLLNAITIDSFSGYNRTTNGFRGIENIIENLKSSPRDIIIDECSMLGAAFFESIYNLFRDYGKRLILVGDFAQAPPVKDKWINHSPLFKPEVHRLTRNYRQGEGEFLDILNCLRIGDVTSEVDEFFTEKSFAPTGNLDDAVILYASNAKAKTYNESKLRKLNSEIFTTKATISSGSGAYCDLSPQEKLRYFQDASLAHEDLFSVGAKVIFTKNNYEMGYINSDIGYIVDIIPGGASGSADKYGFEEDREAIGFVVKLERNNSLIEVNKVDNFIQNPDGTVKYIVNGFPLKLGWAVTIHKSQGGTFNRVHFDMSSLNGYLWAAKKALKDNEHLDLTDEEINLEAKKALHGLIYVGASRVTSAEGLSIVGWKPDYVYTDPFVKDLI